MDSNAVKKQSDKGYYMTAKPEGQSEEDYHRALEEQLQVFGQGLQGKFMRVVGLKEEIEQRWLDDLRHYNGKYDRNTEARFNQKDAQGRVSQNKSRVFVNLTRPKTNHAESKWSDIVLPTDDRNWGIQPTPVPELVDMADSNEPIELADGSVPVDPETGEPHKERDMASEVMKTAKKAAEKMQTEIDDQLTECQFGESLREVIHNACMIGTGILKGPFIEKRNSRKWIQLDQGAANQPVWQLSQQQEGKPASCSVDPWNFFPEMSATKAEDMEFCFERHLMTAKQLRKLAGQPGYMIGQLRKVLRMAPNASAAKLNYLNELRQMNGVSSIQHDNRYEVLEYHGPVSKTDLLSCGCNVDVDDPLEEYEGVVWLCGDIVIKAGINIMDSQEIGYDILNWETDDTSIFGFGVPYRMRIPQRTMNASWRMVIDNAGLSTGPQLLINREVVEPADGSWKLSPRKLWYMKTKDPQWRADYAMKTFDIDSKQQELMNIFEMAHRLADEETSLPQMSSGTMPGDVQQPAAMKTLGGQMMWMTSNNIMMRRAVKNFDDNIIVPHIRRYYDWNMQFNPKSEIKGDYNIKARGTSVLLVREMQARNMESFVAIAQGVVGADAELKPRGVLKSAAKALQIDQDEVMRTDEEYDQALEKMKNEGPPPDPEMEKIKLQREIAQMSLQEKQIERDATLQAKALDREVELTKLAANERVNIKKIQEDSNIKRYKIDWDMKQFYEEAALKERMGPEGNIGLGGES